MWSTSLARQCAKSSRKILVLFLHLAALQRVVRVFVPKWRCGPSLCCRPTRLSTKARSTWQAFLYPPPNYIMYNQSFFDLWAVQFSEASNNYLCLMYLGSREYWLLDRFGMLPVTHGHASPATSSSPDWPPRA